MRKVKISKAILDKIVENGGHWLELEMNNGDKLYIQRQNFESFEDLAKEKFNVGLNRGKSFLVNATLNEVANYIDSKY